MVSPSKNHNQKQKSLVADKKIQQSHVRLQRGDKPLEKKRFYLDIKNHSLSTRFESRIKELGGSIELFLDARVTLVVSDRADKFQQQAAASSDKKKWGYTSGGSAGPPSLRSVEVPTSTWTPPTPSFNGECPLSNSTNTRGHTAQRTKSRVDAMLERALTQPQQCSVDPLDNAFNWGIPIWTTDKLQVWLDKIYASLKDTNTLKCVNRINTDKDLKVKEFKKSYVKFESFKRDTRPVFLELPVWPTFNFDGEPGTCPFDKPREIKEEEKQSNNLINKKKEMTRKPRANTATRARRSEQLVGGFCEICRCDYKDLTKHVQSDKHLTFVRNDDNFLSLDSLINAGANVEAFLKLNQPDDVEKDLYTDGNDNLHNIIRNEEVNQTNKSDLADYGVDELKMVQCNGARRKLNLNLSSPHNLRARAKHESGHLLRSKGSPWHEVDKSEKLFDKLERYTIKKRSKGTIWIEEDEAPDKCDDNDGDDDNKEPLLKDNKSTTTTTTTMVIEKSPLSELNDVRVKNKDSREQTPRKSQELSSRFDDRRDRSKKSILCPDRSISENNAKDNNNLNDDLSGKKKECPVKIVTNNDNKKLPVKDFRCNGSVVKSVIPSAQKTDNSVETFETVGSDGNNKNKSTVDSKVNDDANDKSVKSTKIFKSEENNDKEESNKTKCNRVNNNIKKIAGRSSRARRRQSVEERLIKDNRAFYKVEVIGNKLRSNTAHLNSNNHSVPVIKEVEKEVEKDEGPSSEKPVVVRFKRVRKSELSLLSDEAESFMFGDSRRDEWSNSTDWNNESGSNSSSSVVAKDTETSDGDNKPSSSSIPSSSPVPDVQQLPDPSPVKEEPAVDDDSQDSSNVGRAKKRRRTQAEALIEDNSEYYKFETPGSRLRFQSLPADIVKSQDNPLEINKCDKVPAVVEQQPASVVPEVDAEGKEVTPPSTEEKLYPSKPSAEIEKMRFSFESVPKSEPWYQTYQRQDDGAEFWHYFSESDSRKPFLLPYEIENFHENLIKLCQKNESRKRVRAQGPNGLGRSPRKSPRCHASTLAIMSTIIRKREQQQQQQQQIQQIQQQQSINMSVLNDDTRVDVNTINSDAKSSTDFELKEIVKSIDDMLNADVPFEDSFEPELDNISEEEEYQEDYKNYQQQQQDSRHQLIIASEPSGPPSNLLELLDNCRQHFNGLENSSCASSECGEVIIESPLKRRKRRKNRTGWPGIKTRKKLQCKQQVTPDVDSERENLPAKSTRTRNPDEDEEEEEEEEDGEDEDEEEEDEESRLNQQRIIERLQSSATESADSSSHDSNILPGIKDKNLNDLNESSSCQPSELDNNKNYDEVNSNDLLKKCDEEKSDEGNDENNHDNVLKQQDSRTSTKINLKSTRKRQQQRQVLDARPSSSMTIESHPEIENHDNLCRQKNSTAIISRKNNSTATGLSKRRQRENNSTRESPSADVAADGQVNEATQQSVISQLDDTQTRQVGGYKRKDSVSSSPKKKQTPALTRTKKRPRKKRNTSETSFDDENCKKPDDDDDDEMDCPLSERVILQQQRVVSTPELQQRRSSIEFQPVVRVMKIEDQVDMDHNILSVTVASNRRLRSSSSPKLNSSPPAKRYKRSKGLINRWIKNS
ncbi:uncharacterized protein PF3D7_1120600 isoform X1 [Microplitis demolitor]|uniref:uncharacterized protein PF3D7_1120600 isoform X1 n=1 Tax=Microplitis demolitor TaxID=69319 RepID=UPI0004CD8C1C|nr:uncharacterized protein PF3D7_1120600 isoform X1 [Microplitis demolitor]